MANNDSLGVADYWDTVDYIGIKHDQKAAKAEERSGEPRQTPISKYTNQETAYLIKQFKSPRGQHEATGPGANAVPTDDLL